MQKIIQQVTAEKIKFQLKIDPYWQNFWRPKQVGPQNGQKCHDSPFLTLLAIISDITRVPCALIFSSIDHGLKELREKISLQCFHLRETPCLKTTTGKPRYNEPPCNEHLDFTNCFLPPGQL
jgi:hypothetical protein